MKYIIITAITAFSAWTAQAQSLERQVIGSAGGSFSGSFQVDWTAGETVVQTAAAGSVILTQGFHQPPEVPNSVKPLASQGNFTAFPNPTGSLITLQWNQTTFSGNLNLYDAAGKLVYSSAHSNAENVKLDMSLYAPGIYTFQAIQSDGSTSVIRITRI